MSSPTPDDFRRRYGSYSDEALLEAYTLGADSYSAAAWQIIAAEVAGRGLTLPPADPGPQAPELPAGGGPLTTEVAATFVLQSLEQGISAADIQRRLLENGMSGTEAALVVEATVTSWRREADTMALKALVVGGLWCGGGLAVSLLTYAFATRTGSYFIVAYGAVLYGGVRVIMAFKRLDAVKRQCDLAQVPPQSSAI